MNLIELDNVHNSVFRVERNGSIWWLRTLKDNSFSNLTNESDGYGYEWLNDFIDDIIDNVDYITSSPMFVLYDISDNNIMCANHTVETEIFDSIEDVKTFFKSFRYKGIVVYLIQRHVTFDIKNQSCGCQYKIRYKEFEDVARYRGVKLNEIME